MRNKKRVLSVVVVILLLIGAGLFLLKRITSPVFDIKETIYLYIDESKDYDKLLMQLENTAHIKNLKEFNLLAKASGYPEKVRPGRFAITADMSYIDLLRNLRNGNQSPCHLTFNNIRLKQDFARRISQQLMFSEEELLLQLNDSVVCADLGFTTETILCMFVPNTYDIYWTIPVDKFLKRMKSEYDKFWTPGRLDRAQNIPLSPIQVSILASIVEEETAASSEYATVAGLYINRLKQGMLLQADPTVKFAVGDFYIKRILNIHLETNSPYNTYQHLGLPPGPIRIPSIKGIDCVLNFTSHDYLYMCAKEDFSGKHNFARNFAEHSQNATKYRVALNKNNIK